MFTITQVASSTPYDDTITALGADNVQDAIGILASTGGGVSSEYVAAAASNLLPFYLYSDASDVATYYVMKEGIPPGGGFGLNVAAAITGDLIAAFVSEPGVPGITAIPSGVYKLRAQARQTAGTKTSRIYFEIYKRVLAGTETLLGTSSDSSVLTGVNAEQIVDVVFASPITFLSTDRIVVKVLVNVSGAGTAPDVTVDIQGVTFSRFEWPASVLAAANTYADSVGALQWHLAGNAGTIGTSVVGTTDAQPWTTIAGGIFIDSYAADGQVSSIMNITQPDATTFYQKRNQVNLSVAAALTSGNFVNSNNSVGYSSAFDYAGNISSVGSRVEIGSPNLINFVSSSENSAYFTGGGTTNLVKGVNMNTGVDAGTTIDSYSGVFSSLNSTGGIFGGTSLFAGGMGLTDIASGNVTAFGANFTVDGTSVLSQGTQLFSGSSNFGDTTTVAQNIQGTTVYIQVYDSAAANGGIIGGNTNIQIKDSATSQNINGQQIDISVNNTSVVSSANVIQSQYQIHDSATGGNVNQFSGGLNMDGASALDSYNGVNINAVTSGTAAVTNGINVIAASSNIGGTSTIGYHNGMSIPLTVRNSAVVTGTYTGMFLSQFIENSASAANIFGIDLSMQVNDTSTVTNQYAGLKVSMQTLGGNTFNGAGDLQGIEVNLSGANLSTAKKAAGAKKRGLIISDGTLESNYNWEIPGSTFFGNVNTMGGNVTVVSGDPVINALTIANSIGIGLDFQDDWGPDFTGLRIGFVCSGSVSSIGGAVGKTADTVTINLAAMSNQAGGGTIDKGVGYASMGFLPSGGTLSVNSFYAFHAGPTIAAIVSAGNCWAFHDESGGAENYLGKLAIGSATRKVSNSDVALEIGNSKAFLNGSGTTAQKTAITPIEGMQFYDTDLDGLYWYNGATASWVLAGAASYTDEQEQPAGATDSVNVTFTLSNAPVAPKAVILAINGAIKHYGIDFTVAGTTLTTTVAPTATQNLWVIYRY